MMSTTTPNWEAAWRIFCSRGFNRTFRKAICEDYGSPENYIREEPHPRLRESFWRLWRLGERVDAGGPPVSHSFA